MMSPPTNSIVLAFDLYGTLLDTSSIASQLAQYVSKEKAGSVAAQWRQYQQEYTWRANSMEIYRPFDALTRSALQHALASSDITLEDSQLTSLMKDYNALIPFPDGASFLDSLVQSHQDKSIRRVILTNGTHAMAEQCFKSISELKQARDYFEKIVSVDEVGRYKPAPEVYRHLAEKVGRNIGDIYLVSGNEWDIFGARSAGMRAVWVDRAGKGHLDRLVEEEEEEEEEERGKGDRKLVGGVDEVEKAVRELYGETGTT